MRYLLNLIPILFLAAVSCLSAPGEAQEQLAVADRLMSVRPDSSLSILNAVDTSALGESDMAHYALLLSKAKNKNKIFERDDSLISIAFAYYQHSGDTLEVQAQYYLGEMLGRLDRNDEAIYMLTEAYDKAVAIADQFYAGMCARELCDVYWQITYVADALRWAREAKEMFEKAGRHEHAAWVDPQIIKSLTYTGEHQQALDLSESVDSAIFSKSRSFRHLCMVEKIDALFHLGRYDEVVSLYHAIDSDGYEKDAHDYLKLADSHFRLGHDRDAIEQLQQVGEMLQCTADTLYYKKMCAMWLASDGDYRGAYASAMDFAAALMMKSDQLAKHPNVVWVAEAYRNKSLLKQAEADSARWRLVVLLVAGVAVILLALVLVFYLRAMLYKKSLVADRYAREAADLRDDLSSSIDRLTASEQRLADTHGRLDEAIKAKGVIEKERAALAAAAEKRNALYREKMREAFSMHIATLNDMCSMKYIDNVEVNRKTILKCISGFQKEEMIEKISDIINEYDCGWVDRFKTAFPDLSPTEYLFALYLYMGLNTETIAVLLNLNGPKAVHAAKYRLKKKMQAIDVDKAAAYFETLHINV